MKKLPILPCSILLQTTSGIEAQGEAYIKYTQGPTANHGTVYVVRAVAAPIRPLYASLYVCQVWLRYLLRLIGNRY